MSIMDENGGMVMPVAPMGQSAGGFGGFGYGNDATWLIILFLFIIMGGWNGNNGFGGNMGGVGSLPYYFNNTDNGIRSGFDQAATAATLAGIQSGITNGFSAAEIAACNRAADAMAAAYNTQIANMNQNFANQQALSGQLNGLAMGLQNCCCENRAAVADLKYTVATENCADRQALSDGIRDIIANQNAGYQRVLDQLCADKIDAKNDTIAQLRQELLFARGQASQDVQTAELRANNATVANQLLAEMRSCPIPAQPVYGTQPIFTCNNGGCGCGCGA